MDKVFELKLASGKTVKWHGEDGEDAARRFVDCCPTETVVAWRYPAVAVVVGIPSMVEANNE